MKSTAVLVSMLLLAGGASFALQDPSPDQLKSDLMGKTMGGREKGWKFQSVDQIKELTIGDKKEDANERTYTVKLKLEDPRVSEAFAAEAQVTYEKVGAEWKLSTVGLKSMKKLER